MADFIDSITEGIKVYEYHALLKPYFRMLAVLCSIGDSKQADRINAVMTATLEAVRAQSRYWYATKHCLNLLIQTAKHHHTVCGWLKEVSQQACRGRGVGGRVCDINACGTAWLCRTLKHAGAGCGAGSPTTTTCHRPMPTRPRPRMSLPTSHASKTKACEFNCLLCRLL